jgi:alcohol dehydrogenase class IV/divalent metal cation (Fe/Co/Zn/Cd) transporter
LRKFLTRENQIERWLFFAKASACLNIALAAGKLALGAYSMSLFLCVSALYNVGVACARRIALKGYRSNQAEYRTYRKIGVVMAVSGAVFIVYCLRLFLHGSNVRYSLIESLIIATITFAEIGSSVYGIAVTGNGYSPVLVALKLTSLASALISLALTQTAILSFTADGDMSFYNGLSGMVFGGGAALIGVCMALYASSIISGRYIPKTVAEAEKQRTHPRAALYRAYQSVIRIAMYCVRWRQPELLRGIGCMEGLPAAVKRREVEKALVVTDKTVAALGLLAGLLKGLEAENISYAIYDHVNPNPTIPCIAIAYAMYETGGCSGVIAVGGGSVIDCAKAVCAKAARPGRPIEKMKGLLKVMRKPPPMFAVPTTSGTGSEATLAAVVLNPDTREKYAINDPCLIPAVAVLDPAMTLSLPPNVTATTGMDALTHAVEAYIGRCNTAKTRLFARNAVRLIFENLPAAYQNGMDIVARQNMQQAAFEAGAAFTRAYVGNAHAVAHTLGGFCGIPHGLANAVVLPHVLEAYGSCVYRQLADLADVAGVGGDTRQEKAEAFILAIRKLNAQLGIPDKLDWIKSSDIPAMCKHALAEANPLYPVPVIFTEKDFARIYNLLRMEQADTTDTEKIGGAGDERDNGNYRNAESLFHRRGDKRAVLPVEPASGAETGNCRQGGRDRVGAQG